MLFILFLWEILTLLQNDLKIVYFQKRISILLITFLILNFFTSARYLYLKTALENNLASILNNPVTAIGSFFNSAGNLLIGWIIYIEEAFGLSISNFTGLLAGYLLITSILTIFILFLKRKKDIYKNLIFFSLDITFLLSKLDGWRTFGEWKCYFRSYP